MDIDFSDLFFFEGCETPEPWDAQDPCSGFYELELPLSQEEEMASLLMMDIDLDAEFARPPVQTRVTTSAGKSPAQGPAIQEKPARVFDMGPSALGHLCSVAETLRDEQAARYNEITGQFRRVNFGRGTPSRRAIVYQCASKSSAEDVCGKLERLGIATEVWVARRSFDNPCPFHVVAEAPYVMREGAPRPEEEKEETPVAKKRPASRKCPAEEEEEEEKAVVAPYPEKRPASRDCLVEQEEMPVARFPEKRPASRECLVEHQEEEEETPVAEKRPASRKRPAKEEEEEEAPRKRAAPQTSVWAGQPVNWAKMSRRVPARLWRGKWRKEELGPTTVATWGSNLWIMNMGYGQDVMRWMTAMADNTHWAVLPIEHRPRKGACERKAAADPDGGFHLIVRFADAKDGVEAKTRSWVRGRHTHHVAVLKCGTDLEQYRRIVDHFLALESESIIRLDEHTAMAQRGDWTFL
jgi:hypothetical protein